jgi:hypothetical protein
MKKKSRSRPLIEVRKPLRVRVYRGRFKAFESTRYLNARALRAIRKGRIEVGTVEGAGFKQTVSAEIRNGTVVALKPVACESCAPKRSKKTARPALRQAMQQVATQLRERGLGEPIKPLPIRISPRLGFQIPIGPIIIIIGDPAPGGIFDLCFEWWDGNTLCWWCLIGASGCIGFG